MAGLPIAGHGVQKVGFRPGGSGLDGGTQEFRHDGFRGGELTALAARAGRIGSGLLLAAGADNASRPGGRVPRTADVSSSQLPAHSRPDAVLSLIRAGARTA